MYIELIGGRNLDLECTALFVAMGVSFYIKDLFTFGFSIILSDNHLFFHIVSIRSTRGVSCLFEQI